MISFPTPSASTASREAPSRSTDRLARALPSPAKRIKVARWQSWTKAPKRHAEGASFSTEGKKSVTETLELIAAAVVAAPRAPKTDKFAVRIEALRFVSDHNLMVDNISDWTKSGPVFPEPEWQRTPAANAPISHTRKQKVKAEATFKVILPDADTKSGVAAGVARRDSLSLKGSGSKSFSPGAAITVAVECRGPVP